MENQVKWLVEVAVGRDGDKKHANASEYGTTDSILSATGQMTRAFIRHLRAVTRNNIDMDDIVIALTTCRNDPPGINELFYALALACQTHTGHSPLHECIELRIDIAKLRQFEDVESADIIESEMCLIEELVDNGATVVKE
jgi:hypothetical protein